MSRPIQDTFNQSRLLKQLLEARHPRVLDRLPPHFVTTSVDQPSYHNWAEGSSFKKELIANILERVPGRIYAGADRETAQSLTVGFEDPADLSYFLLYYNPNIILKK